MSKFREVFSIFRPERVSNEMPPPVPFGKARIHLFTGTFETDADVYAYCCSTADTNTPEPLNLDLEEASINTLYLDYVFGNGRTAVLEALFGKASDGFSKFTSGANTLVIVSEEAFDGLAYKLTDTPRLTFKGTYEIDRERFERAADLDFHQMSS